MNLFKKRLQTKMIQKLPFIIKSRKKLIIKINRIPTMLKTYGETKMPSEATKRVIKYSAACHVLTQEGQLTQLTLLICHQRKKSIVSNTCGSKSDQSITCSNSLTSCDKIETEHFKRKKMNSVKSLPLALNKKLSKDQCFHQRISSQFGRSL